MVIIISVVLARQTVTSACFFTPAVHSLSFTCTC